MKGLRSRIILLTALSLLSLHTDVRSELTHRYPFNANANDVIGTAHGTLQGNAFIDSGVVQLDGAQSYVELPAQLITDYPAITVEAWGSYGVNGNWTRIFDFGDTNPESNNGRNYLFFSPHTGNGGLRLAVSDADPGYNHEDFVDYPGVLDEQGPVHIAAVYDPTNRFMAIYTNGMLVASRDDVTIPFSAITNNYSYIGRSLYGPDPYLIGSLDEFRIYNRALNPVEVAASFASGTDNPSTNAGPLQAIRLQTEPSLLLDGVSTVQVLADFQNVTQVNITPLREITYESGDTNILQVSTNGNIRAVGLGSGTLIVSYQGQRATNTVTVVQVAPALKHRYRFTNAPNDTVITDSEGDAHGQLMGTGGNFTGTGQLSLPGGAGGSDAAYVDLPNGIVSARTNLTIEAWVTWNGVENWQRVFDLGNNTLGEDAAGDGTTYLQMTPQAGSTGFLMFEVVDNAGGRPRTGLDAQSPLPIGQETYVAAVYNYSGRQAKLYVNGQLVDMAAAEIPLSTVPDINNWLGRSNFGADPFFNGQYNEFRIWEGALSDIAIALSAAAGPDELPVSDPGALQSVRLQMTNSLFLGALVQASLQASFANVTNVDVTTLPGAEFRSANTHVLSITTNGLVEALGYGTTDLIASFQGQSTTNTVSVIQAPGIPSQPELVHRYSFSESPGSGIVEDLIGSAEGAIMGNATFTGTGQLDLPGGAANSDAGYVDLPNGIISTLTNATFETWFTWRGDAGISWQRIFDFGSNSNGEDQQGTGTTYLQMTPRNGNTGLAYFEAIDNPGGTPRTALNAPTLFPSNEKTHVAVSYNPAAGSARLYLNGQRVAVGSASIRLQQIPDVNNWLGRSNWPDPFLNGQFDEFRIYNGALTDAQVAASFAAGPDNLPATNAPVNLAFERSGTNVVLSWPAGDATDFNLEATPQLGPQGSWEPANVPVVQTNGLRQAIIPTTESSRFFRLRK